MASQRETNTMAEGLQKVLNELTKMKVMPDSDLPFILNLESQIVSYLRPPEAGGSPDQGNLGTMGNAMQTVMGGGGGLGGAPGPGMPNPDEMRRMTSIG